MGICRYLYIVKKYSNLSENERPQSLRGGTHSGLTKGIAQIVRERHDPECWQWRGHQTVWAGVRGQRRGRLREDHGVVPSPGNREGLPRVHPGGVSVPTEEERRRGHPAVLQLVGGVLWRLREEAQPQTEAATYSQGEHTSQLMLIFFQTSPFFFPARSYKPPLGVRLPRVVSRRLSQH